MLLCMSNLCLYNLSVLLLHSLYFGSRSCFRFISSSLILHRRYLFSSFHSMRSSSGRLTSKNKNKYVWKRTPVSLFLCMCACKNDINWYSNIIILFYLFNSVGCVLLIYYFMHQRKWIYEVATEQSKPAGLRNKIHIHINTHQNRVP